ncbi:MAG: hypothetical protein KC561_03860 [Myxococcales bacterium]|nr:hypothetical protein [Myxococcales bacterium]
MDLTISNPRILETCVPYIVVCPWTIHHLDTMPFGVKVERENLIDPTKLSTRTFARLLQQLDRLTFGPEGMPMPRWVFYNCAEVPGAIMGFGRPASQLTDTQRAALEVPDEYDGLVPFSMFIAIPMLPSGDWMAHNLCSMNAVFPELELNGLATVTKAFGLAVYRARILYGATQWHSRALHIHTKFGNLDLVTAYTPAHSEHMTLTYRVEVSLNGLLNACGDPSASIERPEPEFWLDAADEAHAIQMQDQIEAGTRYQIVGPPQMSGDSVRLPLVTKAKPT